MRVSAGEPAGGSMPICRATVMESMKASLRTMRPSRTRKMSTPSSSRRAPLGSMPSKLPGPAKVAVARHWTAARSSCATVWTRSNLKSGNAENNSARYRPDARGALEVDLTGEVVHAVRRPARGGGLGVARRQGLEVAVGDRLGGGVGGGGHQRRLLRTGPPS
jgi:hypothetical protein